MFTLSQLTSSVEEEPELLHPLPSFSASLFIIDLIIDLI